MDLVIKNSQRKICPNDWRIGWRIGCKGGDKHDMMWGSVPPDEVTLQKVIADARRKHNFNKIIDERDSP